MTDPISIGASTDGRGAEEDGRIDLMGMSLEDLCDYVEQELGDRRFRGRQLFKWIYQQRCTDFAEMTNVSKKLRARLSEIARISRMEERAVQKSVDGTMKFLWGLEDGLQVESVLIPEDTRLTLCISTQVGCPLDCDFCVTAKGGYTRNLRRSEILGQVVQAQEHCPDRPISNIVLMGMGEPLLNLDNVIDAMETAMESDGLDLSHRRITLSTVGLIPQMEELGKRSRINLAVSLHGTTEEQRTRLMPINRKYPLADLIEAMKRYPLYQRKLITIEYILIKDTNDSTDDARRLVKLLRDVPAKVNLIPYNKNPFTPYQRPDTGAIVAFQQVLMNAGVLTVTRLNRGGDIDAACGQLGGYKQQRPKGGTVKPVTSEETRP